MPGIRLHALLPAAKMVDLLGSRRGGHPAGSGAWGPLPFALGDLGPDDGRCCRVACPAPSDEVAAGRLQLSSDRLGDLLPVIGWEGPVVQTVSAVPVVGGCADCRKLAGEAVEGSAKAGTGGAAFG